jgi:hypothetical protein
MTYLRFGIRDLLWAMVVVAISVCLFQAIALRLRQDKSDVFSVEGPGIVEIPIADND